MIRVVQLCLGHAMKICYVHESKGQLEVGHNEIVYIHSASPMVMKGCCLI